MTPIAHIAGLPVEETIGMFVPVGSVAGVAVGLSIRARWRRLRSARLARHAQTEPRR